MTPTNFLRAATEAITDDVERSRFQAALARIESGTFGLCVDCAEPIERTRIDRMPLAERCLFCDHADTRVAGLA
jgi:DnaK suppressor protein